MSAMILRSGQLPWRRLITAAFAALAIFLYWTHVEERGQRLERRDVAAAEARDRANVGFVDQRRLDEHYAKHGAEFGNISKQDYLRQA